MRALFQRVSEGSVSVAGREVARIGRGLAVFLAVGRDDEPEDALYIVEKVTNLRIFPDAEGQFDQSALDVDADLLLMSQFTLYANTRKGRRPSFTDAASPEQARGVFDSLVQRFQATGLETAIGVFQETMQVALVNDGPVSIWIDSAERHRPRR